MQCCIGVRLEQRLRTRWQRCCSAVKNSLLNPRIIIIFGACKGCFATPPAFINSHTSFQQLPGEITAENLQLHLFQLHLLSSPLSLMASSGGFPGGGLNNFSSLPQGELDWHSSPRCTPPRCAAAAADPWARESSVAAPAHTTHARRPAQPCHLWWLQHAAHVPPGALRRASARARNRGDTH